MLFLFFVHWLGGQAQRLDPDQQPYWTRYTFVEDSDALVPLKGDYRVYYIQHGMWWNMMALHYPVIPRADEEVRLRPLFGMGYPSLKATPARGKDHPDVKVVVVRGADTMVVELSVYYRARGGEVEERCRTMDCARRPPVVIPFRRGRYLPTGTEFGKEYYASDDAEDNLDARTVSLTKQFDALWKKAMKEELVVPQLNTDTCRQEIPVPADLDLPGTFRDVWVMRSSYCGKHYVHFPLWGTRTEYMITFNPYRPNEAREPVTLDTRTLEDVDYWLDISDWPVGDHPVRLLACDNGGTFTLKLR
ncbi:MAG: hypothetical protein JNL43_00300 [Flavobacteriales bacterium]|nr:hypothetical protein [Flavobacteriales bacterium]